MSCDEDGVTSETLVLRTSLPEFLVSLSISLLSSRKLIASSMAFAISRGGVGGRAGNELSSEDDEVDMSHHNAIQ